MSHKKKKYNKFIASAATFSLVASALPVVGGAASFKDVNGNYAEAVNYLATKGVQGFSKTEFGVSKEIKRVDAAIMLVKALGLDTKSAPASGFKDVPARAVSYINALKAAGITGGKTATTFDSDSLITRGELAIWIQKAYKLQGTSTISFTDVSSRYKVAVTALVDNKITSGVSKTAFGTTQNAKRGDFANFLLRASKTVVVEPVQLEPVSDDATIINATGEVTQDITLAPTGSADLVYGPEAGTTTIKGDVKIAGDASEKISLRNVIVEGNLIVDMPNASVIIDSSTKVTEKVTIINVANQTFTNNGQLGEVELTDADGTRFINGKGATIDTLTINTPGDVTLGGTLPNVVVDQANNLVVEDAANVTNLEVKAPVTINLSSTAKIETLKADETVTLNGAGKVTKITGSKASRVTGENGSIRDAVDKGKDSTSTGGGSSSGGSNSGGNSGGGSSSGGSSGSGSNNGGGSGSGSSKPTIPSPVPSKNHTGILNVTPDTAVTSADVIKITVEDSDLNVNSDKQDEVIVKVSGINKPINLTETTNDSGVFTGTVSVSEAGEFEVVYIDEHNVDGNKILVTASISVLPNGYKLDGDVATVSTDEAFLFALANPVVKTVLLEKGITYVSEDEILKGIVIPEGVKEEKFNFNGANLSHLKVEGDDNIIQNALVDKLTVSSTVDNLTLENVTDKGDSSHVIDGGGGESIVLLGNTTFKGEIRIISKDDIQVRAESPNAKIEGTVWVESGVPVKIVAPVSSVVVNSENEKVVINGKVDKLVVRQNATIIVGEDGVIPTVEKRIGINVEAFDEKGQKLTDIEYKEVLDTSELEMYLQWADSHLSNATVGDKNGQYLAQQVEALESAVSHGKQIYEIYKTETKVDKQTQLKIDKEVNALQQALNHFLASVIQVDRNELVKKWREAQKVANRIVAGNLEERYPLDLYNELLETIQKAKQLSDYAFAVSQKDLDSTVKEIERLLQEIEDFGISDPLVDSTVTFDIKGQNFQDRHVYVEVFPVKNEGRTSHPYYMEPDATVVDGDLKISLTGIDETVAPTFYVVIRANDYLFIEKLSRKEVRDGITRTVKIDESYVPVTVSTPIKAMEPGREDIIMHLLGENGKAILRFDVSSGTKIPSGTYSVQYLRETSNAMYSLFKSDVKINQEDSTIMFTENDISLVSIKLEQQNEGNYRLKYFVPIGIGSMNGKFNSWTVTHFGENVSSVYLSNLKYSTLGVDYEFEKNQKLWEIGFSIQDVTIQGNRELKISDSLKIEGEWRSYLSNDELKVQNNEPLSYYMDIELKDKYNNSINNISEIATDGWPMDNVNGKIIVKANGQKYEKEIEHFRFEDYSIADVVGEASVSGEVTIEFRVDDSPIPIEPFSIDVEVIDQVEVNQ